MLATPEPVHVTNIIAEDLSDAVVLVEAVVVWIEAQPPTSNGNVARARLHEVITLLNS